MLKFGPKNWDCIFDIGPGTSLPKLVESFDINISRGFGCLLPYVEYYVHPGDEVEDRRVIIEFWDRASFREAYRHARLWHPTGLARRVLSC